MTPDKLSEVEFRARNARDFPTVNDAKDCLFIASAKGDVLGVCAALRTAWAERDEARVAYVEAAKQRNEAESRHAFCDENKKDLRMHRDRLVSEVERLRGLVATASARCDDECAWCGRERRHEHTHDCPAFHPSGEVR